MNNQRVTSEYFDHLADTAEWLDGLIGNKMPNGNEIVEGIVSFQIIVNPIQDDDHYHYFAIALVNTR